MTSSRRSAANMSVDQQERQISASYFISSNNRSFIRNRHFAVYEHMSHRPSMPIEAQQEPEPEGHFQDEEGNAISPLSRGHSTRFLESDADSDNSEAIIGNSNYMSHSNMESSHAATPQQTPCGPQHHLIVASSPSFESDGSNFAHTDGNDSMSPVGEANQVERLPPSIPSPNNTNRSRIVSPTRSNYLANLQAEISSLQRDVHGMQASILLLTRNLQKARVARIRKNMISKYGHHNANVSVSSDSTADSGLGSIDALIAECLNSIHEDCQSPSKEQKTSPHSSHAIKSLDKKMLQQKERKSGIRNRFQQRQRKRRKGEQSPSASMAPITTPRRENRITPLGSVQTPSPFHWDDGDEQVKRALFLAGNTPFATVRRKDRGDRTRDDWINRVLLVLMFLATATVLLTTDASIQSIGTTPRRPGRSRLSTKKLTIDLQLNSSQKCYEGSMSQYKLKQPDFVRELRLWKSYREGKARLDPWKALVLSLRGRNSDPWAENNLVSEYTFWL